jgi:hypothetical protein
MAALNGTIKRLVSDKGFGFILATDGNDGAHNAWNGRTHAGDTDDSPLTRTDCRS